MKIGLAVFDSRLRFSLGFRWDWLCNIIEAWLGAVNIQTWTISLRFFRGQKYDLPNG